MNFFARPDLECLLNIIHSYKTVVNKNELGHWHREMDSTKNATNNP